MKPPDLKFSPLSCELIPSALRLSSLAGWNQTANDWSRLVQLGSGGVRVWTDAGEVRASYSVVGYGGRLAWIGMILVDPEYRGRGLGKGAFAAAIEQARSSGFSVMGLDASDLGEPIYRNHGWEAIYPIVRWGGLLQAPREHVEPMALTLGLHAGVLTYDRETTGEDRSTLLHNFALAGCRTISIQSGDQTVAYAVTRPGRLAIHVGPVLAASAEHFATLMKGIARIEAGKRVICDVLDERAEKVLRCLGMRPSRRLNRMTLPKVERCLSGEGIWCGAGFELG